jgi:alpha-glucosidase (family GH31 glycosyl hydrolase)
MSDVPPRDRPVHQRADPVESRRRRLSPRGRKAVLTLHIVSGVGWLGAAYTILVLDVLGARTSDPVLRLGSYEVVHAFNWPVSIPLALTMLVTGAALGLGTRFGLVRHWWVLTKLTLSVAVILANQRLLQDRVELVIGRLSTGTDLGSLPEQLLAISAGIVIALTLVVAVAVFKPWGPTRRREQPAARPDTGSISLPRRTGDSAQATMPPALFTRWPPLSRRWLDLARVGSLPGRLLLRSTAPRPARSIVASRQRQRAARRQTTSRRLLAVAMGLAVTAGLIAVASQNPAALPWRQQDPLLGGVLSARDGSLARVVCDSVPGYAALDVHAAPGRAVTLDLAVEPGERFFGAGERFGSSAELNGQVLDNGSADGMGQPGTPTSYSPTPFVLSSRGYGLQLDTAADATFDFSRSDQVVIHAAIPQLRVYVLTGPDPSTVLAHHAQLVGLPPLPPQWGLGVWKSLIGGPDRVTADTAALQDAGVPLDAVWIYDLVDGTSGFGWPWPVYGPVPTGTYPDPAALIADLHRRGLAVLGYLTPFVLAGHPGYAEAAVAGYLVTNRGGTVFTEPWMGEQRAYVDFTNPAASAWWQARVRYAIGTLGFDGAMQDYGENAPLEGVYFDGEPGTSVRNLYPVLYAQAARRAAQAVKPNDTVLFARSGYTGSQAFVTGRFTGDQTRDWSPSTGLPAVLAGMLNGSVSGWPYWGPDIGGFLDGTGAQDPELWSRWAELGALSPVMRDMLGAQADPLGVQTDPATVATFRGYARLHHALEPYLYRLAQQAHSTGLPLMRPLWLAAPGDPAAWDADDEYMLGPDVLVAPVLHSGMTARTVYLPPGAWQDYWSSQTHVGPGTIAVSAPTQQVPLFTRVGSLLCLPPPSALNLPQNPTDSPSGSDMREALSDRQGEVPAAHAVPGSASTTGRRG